MLLMAILDMLVFDTLTEEVESELETSSVLFCFFFLLMESEMSIHH